MSYEPTNWQTGDIVTAEKLNNMESGISSAGNTLIIEPTITETEIQLNTSFNNIYNTYMSGKNIVIKYSSTTEMDNSINTIFPFTIHQITINENISFYTLVFSIIDDQGTLISNLSAEISDPDANIVVTIETETENEL